MTLPRYVSYMLLSILFDIKYLFPGLYLVKKITLLTTLYSKEYLFNYLKKHCCLHLEKVINLFKNRPLTRS